MAANMMESDRIIKNVVAKSCEALGSGGGGVATDVPDWRVDIINLCVRYYAHSEHFRLAQLTDCWARDDRVCIETAYGNLQGYPAVVEYEKAYMECCKLFGIRHVMIANSIESLSESKAAIARSTVVNVSPGESPDTLATLRIDHNYLTKTSDGWRFRYRRIVLQEPWR